MDDVLADVLESAARLQQLVPDAVLVGDGAAAMFAGHRLSFESDHVLTNLQEHFDVVLEALESENSWATNRTTYGKIIPEELGGIETGLRQLIRLHPLEVDQVVLPSGKSVRVPTPDETLRIKAFLIARRNQTRDYLDVAALAEKAGLEHAASVLSAMDIYYADQNRDGTAVTSQLIRQLSNPQSKDSRTTTQLEDYKGLKNKWRDWVTTVEVCRKLALLIIQQDG
ncbi:nucleotidyl transferase AbiEii/AbiGii toxin family protein [Arthrobacter castelli]|uniref:nucleotidyl transferase AbiEii/AbiGii toxin family protein n=1 Tax=Arthrobacter castelli TaxID=271431 RepID=UPI00042A6937|nr:nucleotidyl transferase AbiEii/AbiGii toxin family protein [Arthrobacter castelli]